MPLNFANVASATALTFFALTGFESATTPVGKVRNPARTLPRALLGGTAFVVLLYLLPEPRIQMLLPADVVAHSPAPFADAWCRIGGTAWRSFAALAIAISAIGCLNGLILGTGELGYAMALRGDLPPSGQTRGVNTPVVAQIVGAGLEHPADPRQQQPRHRKPVHLHHPAVDRGDHGPLFCAARWPRGS